MVQREPKPHRRGRLERLQRLGKRRVHAGGVPLEAEASRAALEPRQVQGAVAHAGLARGVQGFEQLEAWVQAGEKARLELAFGVFVLGLAVEHDARADAQAPGAQAAPLGPERQRANRHREAQVAAGGALARHVDPADGAGVEAAWRVLQPGDQLHGVVLGRAGDRAAGKGGAQQFGQADVRQQLGLDRGGHLEHGGVRLDVEQVGHAHAAGLGDAPEVVAQQVHDHQVLGAVLGVQAQEACGFAVAFHHGAARRGAFHGLGGQAAMLVAHEELGRTRKHVRRSARIAGVGRQRDEGAVGHRLAHAQAPVERERRAMRGEVEPVGVVDLVGLAGADGLVDARDGRMEGAALDARRDVQGAGHAGLGLAVFGGEPGAGVVVRQMAQLAKQQHAQGRGVAAAALAGVEQPCAPFVVGQQHGVQAKVLVGLDLGPHGIERARVDAAPLVREVGVEAARRRPHAGEPVVEERECCGGCGGRARGASASGHRAQVSALLRPPERRRGMIRGCASIRRV